ncbi:MAG TPA: type II toxin-antitoxin system VapB family antitoxin [Gemmatimonadaceae bacterium]|nr:type II toxin-antitoxin system VapB family antitoxin [Gemmatimonadaceae bacterium]
MARKKSTEYPKPKGKGNSVREASFREVPGSDLRRATIFMNGRSQAVRLPKEFRFEGTHVFVRKEGDRVILSPADDRWERFLAAFGSSPDFPDRDQGAPQERPELNAWADASD